MLLGRRSPRICSLVDALPKPKIYSHAAPPIYEMPSKSFLSLEGPDDHDADEMVDRVAWLDSDGVMFIPPCVEFPDLEGRALSRP